MAKRQREEEEEQSSPTDTTTPNSAYTPEPEPSVKIIHLNHEQDESGEEAVPAMQCSLPPHKQTLSFTFFEDYDVHYSKFHMNRCLECRKNFPTEHFLNVHILENHDSLVSIRRERGEKTYGCFVEDCDRLCSSPEKRRMHLIDKHMFPKDYDFYIVNDGIDRRSSMLKSGRHRRRSSAAQIAKRQSLTLTKKSEALNEQDGSGEDIGRETKGGMDVEEKVVDVSREKDDMDVDDLAGAMAALEFVPTSVRFGRGRGRGRGGFSRS